MKFAGDSGNVVEFALTDLNVTLRNAPLAPSDPGNAQRFEAEAVIRLEVPVRFGRKLLPSCTSLCGFRQVILRYSKKIREESGNLVDFQAMM